MILKPMMTPLFWSVLPIVPTFAKTGEEEILWKPAAAGHQIPKGHVLQIPRVYG